MSIYNAPPPAKSSSGGLVLIVVIVALLMLLGLAVVACGLGILFMKVSFENREPSLPDVAPAKHQMDAQSGPLPEIVSMDSTSAPLDPSQDRIEWVYAKNAEGASGTLRKISATNWSETRSDRVSYSFTETARTPENVELLDASRGLFVRLFPDHMEWRRDGQDWTHGQSGGWSPSP